MEHMGKKRTALRILIVKPEVAIAVEDLRIAA
jgi:hypothetical protein